MCAPKTEFIITISVDGQLKFWAKSFHLIEFVKHYRAHRGIITSASLSFSQERLCTTSPEDQTLKIFDVLNTDLHNMVKLNFVPFQCEFLRIEGTSSIIAVS